MPPASVRSELLARAISPGLAPGRIRSLQEEVREAARANSSRIRSRGVESLHADDVAFIFDACDRAFLGGLCRRAVAPGRIRFRLSKRMTRAAGSTARLARGKAAPDFEVAVSAFLLFDGFDGGGDPPATVAGLPCASRLEALQRIVEHELVHVVEYAATGDSSCSRRPFQQMAEALFGHRRFTHELLTRRARAARKGIVVGSRVSFAYDGARLAGRVNRVTKRATVLVPDPAGQEYSNGRRYAKYYVPLEELRRT